MYKLKIIEDEKKTYCTNMSTCFKMSFNLKSGICVAFKKSGNFTVTKYINFIIAKSQIHCIETDQRIAAGNARKLKKYTYSHKNVYEKKNKNVPKLTLQATSKILASIKQDIFTEKPSEVYRPIHAAREMLGAFSRDNLPFRHLRRMIYYPFSSSLNSHYSPLV